MNEIPSVIVEPIFLEETLDIMNDRTRQFIKNGVLDVPDNGIAIYKPKFPGWLGEAVIFDDLGNRLNLGVDYEVIADHIVLTVEAKYPLELAYEHIPNVHVDLGGFGNPGVWAPYPTSGGLVPSVLTNGTNTPYFGGTWATPLAGTGPMITMNGVDVTLTDTPVNYAGSSQLGNGTTSNTSSAGTVFQIDTMDNYLTSKTNGWSIASASGMSGN